MDDLNLKLEVRPTVRARSPRELLIFSLDDTLVDTSLYWLARTAVARAVAEKTGTVQDIGIGRIYQVWAKHEAVTVHDTWEAFQKVAGVPQDPDGDMYSVMARTLRSEYPIAIPGAEALLRWAQPRFTLALLTEGEPAVQMRKLEAAAFNSFFKEVKIVHSKGTEAFQALISGMGFSPRNSWVIGTSVAGDLNPALEAGAHAIHFPNPHVRHTGLDERDEEPVKPVFRIRDLVDARAILAKPAIGMAA
jgi:putative hydrolase of the HAD superfamily